MRDGIVKTKAGYEVWVGGEYVGTYMTEASAMEAYLNARKKRFA